MNEKIHVHERSLSRGVIAGLLGGIAGAAAMLVAEEIFPPHPSGKLEPATSQALHWSIGAVAGGVYGIAAELEPSLTAWRGAAFGISLHRMTREAPLPRMGMSTDEQRSLQAGVSGWISHAVYGMATDAVLRIVRRVL